MNIIKWILLECWTPLNIRFGVVYGFFAQLKFLVEIMLLIGGGYFLWFNAVPSRKLLVLIFIAIFLIAAGIGDVLIRLNVPQRIAEKQNKINPQLDLINKIAEKLGVKND